MVHTFVWGSTPKVVAPIIVVVLDEFINPQVKVLYDLRGKVEHTCLVDIDFIDVGQYPLMVVHTFMEWITFPDGNLQW
jgi:hypothetical protein